MLNINNYEDNEVNIKDYQEELEEDINEEEIEDYEK